MSIRFEPVVLDTAHDGDGQLIYRNDRLTAVVSQLGDMHDDLAGHWFIEATFDGSLLRAPAAFATLGDVASWIEAAP